MAEAAQEGQRSLADSLGRVIEVERSVQHHTSHLVHPNLVIAFRWILGSSEGRVETSTKKGGGAESSRSNEPDTIEVLVSQTSVLRLAAHVIHNGDDALIPAPLDGRHKPPHPIRRIERPALFAVTDQSLPTPNVILPDTVQLPNLLLDSVGKRKLPSIGRVELGKVMNDKPRERRLPRASTSRDADAAHESSPARTSKSLKSDALNTTKSPAPLCSRANRQRWKRRP